ncbi:MAG: MFS transporter [Kofleriaceae bacterium]
MSGFRDRFVAVARVAPRAYWYVWWGTLVNRLGGFVIPMLTIYLTTVRDLDVAEAGGIVAVYGAGSILASQLGGQLSDRLGRKATMVISLFGGAIAMATLGFARDLTTITIMVGVVGLVCDLYRPAVLAFVADVIPEPERIQAYGLLYWVINVGFAVAAVVGGVLADVDFTILFLADASTMAIYGVIVLLAVPETRPARVVGDRPASRSWVFDGVFVAFVVISFGIALLPMQAGATLSAHMTWQGFTPMAYGIVMGVNGVVVIVLQPFITVWCARFDPTRVLVGAVLLTGAGIMMHGLAGSIAVHMVAVTLWTLGEILESPTRSTIVARLAPADARGRYQGAIVMAWGASQLVGPKLGTQVWAYESPLALWLGCGVLAIVVALGLTVSGPALRRRRASVPSPSGSS